MTEKKTKWGAYLKFFWPLSLFGVLMQIGRLAQNRVLLDFQEGVRELAMFALALAILGPFRSVLAMVPQMVTVMGGSSKSRQLCFRFVTIIYLAISLPLLVLAWTPSGNWLAQWLYDVDDGGAQTIVAYLRFLSPILIINGWRQYCTGLLIRQKRTGWVTALQAISQFLVVTFLAVGMRAAWPATRIIGLSAVMPAFAGLVIATVLLRRTPVVDDDKTAEGKQPQTYGALVRYFWPLAMTTFMFTLSRPIIFALVTRLNPTQSSDGVDTTAMIAALSLAFSCGIMFQGTINQFRHFMVAFAGDDPRGIRRFMVAVTTVVTGLMVLALVTPAARWFLGSLQGATGHTLEMTLDALWVLMLVPIVIAWRNYHHGMAMVQKRTIALAAGSLARNGSILVVGITLLLTGHLNHWTSAGLLLTAFTCEAMGVVMARHVQSRRKAGPDAAD